MGSAYLATLFAGLGAVSVLCVVFVALQQDEHRRNGLVAGPDPRAKTASLLSAVLRAVPLRHVRAGRLGFEDGSGLLLADADMKSLDELSRLAAAREVFLERVYEMRAGWRLVFRGGSTRAFVDVAAWQLVAPSATA
jgi:hypothetical protein